MAADADSTCKNTKPSAHATLCCKDSYQTSIKSTGYEILRMQELLAVVQAIADADMSLLKRFFKGLASIHDLGPRPSPVDATFYHVSYKVEI